MAVVELKINLAEEVRQLARPHLGVLAVEHDQTVFYFLRKHVVQKLHRVVDIDGAPDRPALKFVVPPAVDQPQVHVVLVVFCQHQWRVAAARLSQFGQLLRKGAFAEAVALHHFDQLFGENSETLVDVFLLLVAERDRLDLWCGEIDQRTLFLQLRRCWVVCVRQFELGRAGLVGPEELCHGRSRVDVAAVEVSVVFRAGGAGDSVQSDLAVVEEVGGVRNFGWNEI